MITAATFLEKVERYLEQHDVAPTAFGKAAVGDPNFVSDLRAGRTPGLRLVDRVNAYIDNLNQESAA